ncbi:MAG: hypothetical protein M3Y64_10215 [Gemmatimonadota bacterium]|nr:hypothetical protein [Gemmatimonadota bacterium]
MTPGNYVSASARASLEGARVALGRMMSANTASREIPLTMAARAADAWVAVETVLRDVTAHADLSGQLLLAEARKQNVLSLDEAHALVAMNDWVDRTRAPGSAAQMLTLPPTEAEREVATRAMAVLERVITNGNADVGHSGASVSTVVGDALPASLESVPVVAPVPGVRPSPLVDNETPALTERSEWAPPKAPAYGAPNRIAAAEMKRVFEPVRPDGEPILHRSSRSRGLIVGVVLVAALAVGGAGWYLMRNRSASTSAATTDGVTAYTRGSTETARMQFAKALETNKDDTRALIYLGRMAREQHDNAAARRYLEHALQVEPENALALREYGSVLLADGQPELARRFYVHALNVDATDKIAQGFLGCSLLRLQRPDEAQRWFDRAGRGDWTSCATTPTPK